MDTRTRNWIIAIVVIVIVVGVGYYVMRGRDAPMQTGFAPGQSIGQIEDVG